MTKILFIGVTALKEKSVIQANVDEKVLALSIKEFQEIEIESILGDTEYNRLSDELVKVQTGVISELTPDDQSLMDMITPVMIYGALMYSIAPITEKFTNKGIQHDRDLNAETAGLGEARSNYGFKLDAYRRKLILYIAGKAIDKPCHPEADTTYNFTGVALDDYTPDMEGMYRSNYYKDGRGRRII